MNAPARPDGDEFTALVEEGHDPADAIRVGERMLDALLEAVAIAGRSVDITASIVVATSRSGYESADDVLRDADLAMYRAKALGAAAGKATRSQRATESEDR